MKRQTATGRRLIAVLLLPVLLLAMTLNGSAALRVRDTMACGATPVDM
jgi:hypothetical protein